MKYAIAMMALATVAYGATGGNSEPESTPGSETDLKRVEYVDMYRGRYRLSWQVWGGGAQPSKTLSITSTDPAAGSISLTYATQLGSVANAKGHTKYQAMLKGKFVAVDKTATALTARSSFRICMEIGTADKFRTFREAFRFHAEGTVWGEPEMATAFDAANADAPYRFCAIPDGDTRLTSKNTGYKITGAKMDAATRTATVEFERAFATGATGSLTLVGDQTYKAWIQWGLYDDKTGVSVRRVYGARNVDQALNWSVLKPPARSLLNAVSLSTSLMMIISLASVALY